MLKLAAAPRPFLLSLSSRQYIRLTTQKIWIEDYGELHLLPRFVTGLNNAVLMDVVAYDTGVKEWTHIFIKVFTWKYRVRMANTKSHISEADPPQMGKSVSVQDLSPTLYPSSLFPSNSQFPMQGRHGHGALAQAVLGLLLTRPYHDRWWSDQPQHRSLPLLRDWEETKCLEWHVLRKNWEKKLLPLGSEPLSNGDDVEDAAPWFGDAIKEVNLDIIDEALCGEDTGPVEDVVASVDVYCGRRSCGSTRATVLYSSMFRSILLLFRTAHVMRDAVNTMDRNPTIPLAIGAAKNLKNGISKLAERTL
jgi:hypothetical protein